MKHTYNTVLNILRECPEARDDDNILIVKVDTVLNPAVNDMPYSLVMLNRKQFGLPSCETIRRSRQRAQELNADVRASNKAKSIRKIHEEEVLDFVRCKR